MDSFPNKQLSAAHKKTSESTANTPFTPVEPKRRRKPKTQPKNSIAQQTSKPLENDNSEVAADENNYQNNDAMGLKDRQKADFDKKSRLSNKDKVDWRVKELSDEALKFKSKHAPDAVETSTLPTAQAKKKFQSKIRSTIERLPDTERAKHLDARRRFRPIDSAESEVETDFDTLPETNEQHSSTAADTSNADMRSQLEDAFDNLSIEENSETDNNQSVTQKKFLDKKREFFKLSREKQSDKKFYFTKAKNSRAKEQGIRDELTEESRKRTVLQNQINLKAYQIQISSYTSPGKIFLEDPNAEFSSEEESYNFRENLWETESQIAEFERLQIELEEELNFELNEAISQQEYERAIYEQEESLFKHEHEYEQREKEHQQDLIYSLWYNKYTDTRSKLDSVTKNIQQLKNSISNSKHNSLGKVDSLQCEQELSIFDLEAKELYLNIKLKILCNKLNAMAVDFGYPHNSDEDDTQVLFVKPNEDDSENTYVQQQSNNQDSIDLEDTAEKIKAQRTVDHNKKVLYKARDYEKMRKHKGLTYAFSSLKISHENNANKSSEPQTLRHAGAKPCRDNGMNYAFNLHRNSTSKTQKNKSGLDSNKAKVAIQQRSVRFSQGNHSNRARQNDITETIESMKPKRVYYR